MSKPLKAGIVGALMYLGVILGMCVFFEYFSRRCHTTMKCPAGATAYAYGVSCHCVVPAVQ